MLFPSPKEAHRKSSTSGASPIINTTSPPMSQHVVLLASAASSLSSTALTLRHLPPQGGAWKSGDGWCVAPLSPWEKQQQVPEGKPASPPHSLPRPGLLPWAMPAAQISLDCTNAKQTTFPTPDSGDPRLQGGHCHRASAAGCFLRTADLQKQPLPHLARGRTILKQVQHRWSSPLFGECLTFRGFPLSPPSARYWERFSSSLRQLDATSHLDAWGQSTPARLSARYCSSILFFFVLCSSFSGRCFDLPFS